MGFLQRQLVKVVMGVVTWPKVTVAVCAVLLVACVFYARTRLSLSTDQNAMLPKTLPFFQEFLRFDSKFPENEAFVVLVEPKNYGKPPPAKRWIELATQVEKRMLALKGDVKRVDARTDPASLGDQAMLFAEWEDVKGGSAELKRMVPLLKIIGEKPGMLDRQVLGGHFTERLYSALGKDAESREFVTLITRSLHGALDKPVGEWTRAEIPDMTELDPSAKLDPGRYGYYMIADETKREDPARKDDRIMVINIYDERDFSSLDDVTEPLQRMRAVLEGVKKEFPEFEVGLTGRPALEADQMRNSDQDTKKAEILGLSLVFVALWLFLRKLWLVIVAEVCLGVGIGWTFGWATLAVGRLNLLSLVFVIALIGIGMDYLIQILTRYRFEKKRYVRPQAIWSRVFRYVSAPISTACLGAAGAFLVANLTNFKGAAELGLIAGGGLLLCLASGYTLLPALLTLFPANVGKVSEEERYHDPAKAQPAGGWRLAVVGLWVVLAVVGIIWSGMPAFDPNLLKLQASDLESVKLVHKLPTWSAAAMASDVEELRRINEVLKPREGEKSPILKTDSVVDAIDKQAWMAANNQALGQIEWAEPEALKAGDVGAVAKAIEGVPEAWDKVDASLRPMLRETAAKVRKAGEDAEILARLNEWEKRFWGDLRANARRFLPPKLDLGALPPTVRDHYVSYRRGDAVPLSELSAEARAVQAKPTYALYILPREDLWQEGNLESFVREIEARRAKAERPFSVTGIAVQLLYSTREIHRAFLLSTLYALGLIFVLVLIDLRKLGQTFLAISVLGLGLPMLLFMMWVWRSVPLVNGMTLEAWTTIPSSWNFANFFGLPILIGAGHEYGVFMVHRYRETLDDPRRVWGRWDVSDRALLLCAIVTSCSFGFLMLAQHRGLASLGWVMAVGSACIYLATIMVLRPVLHWRLKRLGVYLQPSKKTTTTT
jgi:predicted RND superfamily exporter protein